jgi:hypothetical protein
MKTLSAALLLLLVGQASATPTINPLGLKTLDNTMLVSVLLDQPRSFQPLRTPPRGLCAKADYYCIRGYQNWCEVWTINRCDELLN